MQFLLDKKQRTPLFEQAREQLLTALHTGKLRPGDRLPSVRQVAHRNTINLKTAFSIYQRLRDEGYVALRTGSGAYVSEMELTDLDQAYCLSIFQLIKSNLSQASQLKLDPTLYTQLVKSFVDRSSISSKQVAVIECNEEQVNLFAGEISSRLGVHAIPLLLSQIENGGRDSSSLLAGVDYFVTTDYHFRQVDSLLGSYGKKILQLRLDPDFVPELVGAAGRGRVLMIVSNTSFFPAFRRHLESLGTPPAVLEHIDSVDDKDLSRVQSALVNARYVYVSPICDAALLDLIPRNASQLKIDNMLSLESIEMLEAVMLFHTQQ